MSEKPPLIAFPAYLVSSSLWVAALGLENLLVSWILVGVLQESADVFGQSRAFIALPPLLMLLVGGVIADRVDARKLLISVTLVTAIAPLLLASSLDSLSIWLVIAFGTSIALLNAISDPARQAMLNRITRTDIQRTVTIVMIVPSLVSMASMSLLTQLEVLGLAWVLVILSVIFVVSALALIGLPKMEPAQRSELGLLSGFRAILNLPLIRDLIAMNFLSALFNAGGYMVAMPFIATQVYGAQEGFFATVMIVFTLGSTGSNFVLLFIMPLRRPGRVFVALQLTRAVILVAMIIEPSAWLFLVLVFLWGVNMGITSTLMRSNVQELAPVEHRAQILSFQLFSFMLSSPLSALILGSLIAATSPLTALVPGIPLSIALFIWGMKFSGLWNYQSVSYLEQR